MSIFDLDGLPVNIPLPTMGGQVFWEQLDYKNGYTLQKLIWDGHCRILDANDVRIAWGSETQMRAKFRELTEPQRHAEYGDIIGVHRWDGVYDHYGVYESDQVVYHYAAKNNDFGNACIHVTTLKGFIRDSDSYFVLHFPEEYGKPAKIEMPVPNTIIGDPTREMRELLIRELKKKKYHLFSPAETIERAKSRLGESRYNLVVNNCEHFAIWCKTGLHESHQVEGFLDWLSEMKEMDDVIILT